MDQNREYYLDLMQKVILNETNPENGARIAYLLDLLGSGKPAPSRTELIATLVSLHRDNVPFSRALSEIDRPRHWWTRTLGFPFSMIGARRLSNARLAARTVLEDGVPGAMIETGVWRGGACIMMKSVMKAYGEQRDLFVCDSFEGLPAPDNPIDAPLVLNENPILTAPLEDVRSHFARLGLLDDHVHFIKGWFADTLAGVATQVGPEGISVLRLDGDYYSSTMDALRPLCPLVNKGGFVIIDDYHAYAQCKQAVEEYRAEQGIDAEMIEIDGVGIYWRV